MDLQKEPEFLLDVLARCRVRAQLLPLASLAQALTAADIHAFLLHSAEVTLPPLAPYTVYRRIDSLGLCHLFFLMPKEETVFLLGPYLASPIAEGRISALCDAGMLSRKRGKRMKEYCAGLPILSDGCQLLSMVEVFCERLFKGHPLALEELEEGGEASPLHAALGEAGGLDGVLVDMRALEQRYTFENEMMRAVKKGQAHREQELLSAFSEDIFERRVEDPTRNAKNYGIIMNTLLRKAAEEGGVHPLHLDRVSSDFAARIEALRDHSAALDLMRDMFRTYCRLVRKHTHLGLSSPVQRVVLLVDAELSSDLCLSALASAIGVSPPYLSSLFRKEMGKTLSTYVRERRMAHAKYLLAKTDLQVQTVAQQCGIMDVQYFSRLFRRTEGRTPLEYRAVSRSRA